MSANFMHGFYDPYLPMSASQAEKETANLISAASREISAATMYHEIVRARVDWTGSALSSNTTVTFRWYNSDLNKLLFTYNYTWLASWTHAYAIAWIGHLPSGEIDRAGNYRVEITSALWSKQTINFVITEAAAPEPPPVDVTKFVISAISADPATVEMPADLSFHATVENQGDTTPYINLDYFLVKPDNSTQLIHTVLNQLMPVGQIRTWHIPKTYTNLLPGTYGLKVRIIDPTIFNIHAEKTITNAFTVEGEAPLPESLVSLQAEALTRHADAMTQIATYGFPEVFNYVPWMNDFKIKVITAGFTLYEDWTVSATPPEPIPDDPVPWFANILQTSFDTALATLLPLPNTIKNIILNGLLQVPTLKSLLEDFARWLGNKFADDYPEFAPLKGAPENSLTILAILGIIGGILGFGTLINWARKELPEPSGMAVWAAIEAQDWNLANDANQQYKKFINAANGFVGTTFSWFNPFVKSWFDINRDSQLATADNYQEIIDANLTAPSTLNVSSIPTGAKIYVDGEYKFEVTNTSITLTSGHHTIVLKKTDYRDESQEIDIAAGETKYISMTLTSITEPEPEPTPEPPDVPAEEVVIPLVPSEVVYNAWKVTIKAVDASTNEPLSAAILINDEFMENYTPWWYYFAPESSYNIKIRKKGYRQGEVTYTTPALPER